MEMKSLLPDPIPGTAGCGWDGKDRWAFSELRVKIGNTREHGRSEGYDMIISPVLICQIHITYNLYYDPNDPHSHSLVRNMVSLLAHR